MGLELRFPSLRQESEVALYATPASIESRRIELKRLLEEEIPANRKAIEEARAMGDLRENFEYKSARQRHEYLASRTGALDRDLRRVRPLDPATIDTNEVRIGTRLGLRGADGSERTLTVLGPWETKPEEGVVSYESELGLSLLGKKVGDAVEVEGVPYTLTAIGVYVEA
jgi:transcription elongation GreA/GreB family factor